MDEYKIVKEYEDAEQKGTLPEMPKELDTKCRELIDEAFGTTKRHTKAKHISAAIARVAMVVLILLGLSTVTVLSVDAFRVPVLNFLMDESGKYSTVVLDPTAQKKTVDTNSIVQSLEAYIPGGYSLLNRDLSSQNSFITYKNDEGHQIRLLIDTDTCELNVDTENISHAIVEFGGFYAIFWEKHGYHLIWLDGENQTVYNLWASNLEKQAFWELAYALIA